MEKQRVNKVTALFNAEDGVTMTLYRTHNKLGSITSAEVGVKPFAESGAQNKSAYMQYCREVVINLLQNDGVEGFYYDPVSHDQQTEKGIPKKFTSEAFRKWSADIVSDKLTEMADALGDITPDILDQDQYTEPEITERYADGNIKYGTLALAVKLHNANGEDKAIRIPVEIRSGQLCKPKTMVVADGSTKSLNPTNIKAMFSTVATTSKQPTIKASAQLNGDKEVQKAMDKEMNEAVILKQAEKKIDPVEENNDQSIAMAEAQGNNEPHADNISKIMGMLKNGK